MDLFLLVTVIILLAAAVVLMVTGFIDLKRKNGNDT